MPAASRLALLVAGDRPSARRRPAPGRLEPWVVLRTEALPASSASGRSATIPAPSGFAVGWFLAVGVVHELIVALMRSASARGVRGEPGEVSRAFPRVTRRLRLDASGPLFAEGESEWPSCSSSSRSHYRPLWPPRVRPRLGPAEALGARKQRKMSYGENGCSGSGLGRSFYR